MLCTAPTVIKHCCPPAAPQCIPHQPPTLQPSYTFHSLIFTQAQTAPQAPHLKCPTYPLSHLNHIPCIHHSPHLQHTHTQMSSPQRYTLTHISTQAQSTLSIPTPPTPPLLGCKFQEGKNHVCFCSPLHSQHLPHDQAHITHSKNICGVIKQRNTSWTPTHRSPQLTGTP